MFNSITKVSKPRLWPSGLYLLCVMHCRGWLSVYNALLMFIAGWVDQSKWMEAARMESLSLCEGQHSFGLQLAAALSGQARVLCSLFFFLPAQTKLVTIFSSEMNRIHECFSVQKCVFCGL